MRSQGVRDKMKQQQSRITAVKGADFKMCSVASTQHRSILRMNKLKTTGLSNGEVNDDIGNKNFIEIVES